MTKPQQLQTKPYTAREENILRFFHKFYLLDSHGRQCISCFVDSLPYSWDVVCAELIHGTALSRRMLVQIVRNGFSSMEED